MKIGIAGFAGSGKSTVFHWLTGVKPDPAASQRGQVGIAKLPDVRLDWLSDLFGPKKTTPATIEFLDTPGLIPNERRDNPRRLGILREAGGLLVVLNGFGTGDLCQELRNFRDELLFADLEIVSNRVDKLREMSKKPRPAKEKEAEQFELATCERAVAAFEAGTFASELGLKEEEEKCLRSFQLLTLKSQVVLVNAGDDRAGKPAPAELATIAPGALAAPARLEMELAELSEEDRMAFMADLGLAAFCRDAILQGIFAGMGRMVFFTVGEDECRAWGLPRGASSVDGAGQIHTDLAKRFVRAEVVGYEDFVKVGSMKEAKSRGVYRLEGKTYTVQDGDIMHILASG